MRTLLPANHSVKLPQRSLRAVAIPNSYRQTGARASLGAGASRRRVYWSMVVLANTSSSFTSRGVSPCSLEYWDAVSRTFRFA